jgi:hypothetical protein
MVSKQDFIKKIKAKYTIYNNIPDDELFSKITTKYPDYLKQIDDDNLETKLKSGIKKSIGIPITVGEVAGGFTPASPLFQGVGETVRGITQGKSLKDAGTQGLKAAAFDVALGGAGKAKSVFGLFSKKSPAIQLSNIGNKISETMKTLRKQEGVRVGSVKSVLKQNKTPIPIDATSDIVTNIEKEIASSLTPSGGSSLGKVEVEALRRIQKELISKPKMTANDLFSVKELIRNDLLNTVRSKKALQGTASNGERILLNVSDSVNDLLLKHDALVTGGQLAKVNEKFAKVAKTYEKAQDILGVEKNMANNVKRLGDEIAKENPYYTQFADDLSKFSSKATNFLDELDTVAKTEKLKQKLASVWGLGDIIKIASASKLGVEVGAKSLGIPKMLKAVTPTARVGLEQLTLNPEIWNKL